MAPNDAGCPSWNGFVAELENAAKVSSSTDDTVRRAHHATRALGRRSENALLDAVRNALYKSDPKATDATRQLASVWWPLVLSTNYDDLFFRAYCPPNAARLPVPRDFFQTPAGNQPGAGNAIGYEMRVLGRAVGDCDRVLLSLRETGPSILWALHGFLRKGVSAQPGDQRDDWRRLESELVIGHESYQQIVHAAVHYRRAFGEVYRQRSFLFLGSSLSDPYLLGLFAEVQELYGRSSLPHFAMVCAEDKKVDVEFLKSRFNMRCIQYDKHDDLPELLKAMNAEIEEGATRGTRWEFAADRRQRGVGRLAVEYSDLPLPLSPGSRGTGKGACIVFGSASDGSKKGNGSLPFGPHFGAGFRDALAADLLKHLQTPANWQQSDVFPANSEFAATLLELKPQAGESTMRYAVVTAWRTLGASAIRDLRQISVATQAALMWAATNGFDEVHMPLLATGSGSGIAGRSALIEMVRGYACWFKASRVTRAVSLVLHLRNKAALFELSSGRTDIVEILSSPSMLRFWLEVSGAGEGSRAAGTDRELMLCDVSTKLKDVLDRAHLSFNEWSAEVDPPPTGGRYPLGPGHLGHGLEEIGLVPGATLRFTRK